MMKLTDEQIQSSLRVAQRIMGWVPVDEMIGNAPDQVNRVIVDTASVNEGSRIFIGHAYEFNEHFAQRLGNPYGFLWRQWNPYDRDWIDLVESLRQHKMDVQIGWNDDTVSVRAFYLAKHAPDNEFVLGSYTLHQGMGRSATVGEAVVLACLNLLTCEDEIAAGRGFTCPGNGLQAILEAHFPQSAIEFLPNEV